MTEDHGGACLGDGRARCVQWLPLVRVVGGWLILVASHWDYLIRWA